VRRLLGISAIAAAVGWSILAWGGSALLGTADGLFGAGSSLAESYPEPVAWLAPMFSFMAGVGSAGVTIVWLVGLAIIAVLYLIGRLVFSQVPVLFDGYGESRRYSRRGSPGRSSWDLAEEEEDEDDDRSYRPSRRGKRRDEEDFAPGYRWGVDEDEDDDRRGAPSRRRKRRDRDDDDDDDGD